MRSLVLAALAIVSFTAMLTYWPAGANAVVCARGIYRAGCVGPNGAVVVRRPYYPVRPYYYGRRPYY